MAGSVLFKYSSAKFKNFQVENVIKLEVAGPFLAVSYADGAVVLLRAEDFSSVQFTPYPADSEGEQDSGTSTDDPTS